MRTFRLMQGDSLSVLKTLPDESVNCCVTSPPYWGLRRYLPEQHELKPLEFGSEPTMGEYIARAVVIFREVRRVLRSDGVMWLNLGDSYSVASTHHGANKAGIHAHGEECGAALRGRSRAFSDNLKPKDLCMIPARVAIALQDDGWYLRSDVIWAKPNPMPSSVTDRPTCSHEYLFLLSKSERYYFDAESIKEPRVKVGTPGHLAGGSGDRAGTRDGLKGRAWVERKQDAIGKNTYTGFNARWDEAEEAGNAPLFRNKRSVWTIPTHPYPEAHFATFPPALVEPCIKAGCPSDGTVLDPFNGAGTTGLVACRLDRNYIGIDLNPEYVEMSRRRIVGDAPMFNQEIA